MAGGTPRTLLLLLLLLLCLLLRLGGGRKAAGAGQRSRRVQTAGAGGSARSKRSPQAFHDWEDDDDDDDEEEEQDEDDEQVQGFDVGYSDEEEEEEEEIGDDDDEEDDDEDDDDEDDFPDRLPSTRERAPSYPSWKRASSRRRDDYRRIPAIDTALVKAKLGAVASQLTSTVSSTKRSVTRELRMYTSGSWEKRLLAATWPDNDIPDPKLVKEIMREVSQFRRDLDVTRQSSEHRIFLHKIWLKMTELDWRTKVKALYLLHAIVTRLPPEDAVVMQRFILKMGREKCKKSKSNYFDLEVISETDPAGQHWHGFVGRYGEYVLKRAATFSGAFDELKALKREHGFENVVAVLVKARKLIDLSLTCGPEADEEAEITVLALKLVARDVCQLFGLMQTQLRWVIEDAASGGELFADADRAVVQEMLRSFKDFHAARYEDVAAFLAEAKELLAVWGMDSGSAAALNLPPMAKL